MPSVVMLVVVLLIDDQLNRIKCIRTKLNRPYRLDEDHMLKIRILLCGFLESMFKKSFDDSLYTSFVIISLWFMSV